MIFFQLLRTEFYLFSQIIKNKLINVTIWAVSCIFVNAYIMPALGLSADYGVFLAAAIIISAAGFEVYGQLFAIVGDIDGQQYINYQLTLPASSLTIWTAKVVFYTLNSLFLSIITLFFSKLILWNIMSLRQVDYLKFCVTLIVANIFFGWFTLFLAGLTKTLAQADDVCMRIMFPLWYFGAFSFSLHTAYSVSPLLWGLCLISPYTFATEAFRCAMLGPVGYLPFWLSIGVLSLMTVGVGYFGYNILKKRLDFI